MSSGSLEHSGRASTDGCPYEYGDAVVVTYDGPPRVAIVTAMLATNSLDPTRRWRILGRWAEETGVSLQVPLYCGDDGHGEHVCPARPIAGGRRDR